MSKAHAESDLQPTDAQLWDEDRALLDEHGPTFVDNICQPIEGIRAEGRTADAADLEAQCRRMRAILLSDRELKDAHENAEIRSPEAEAFEQEIRFRGLGIEMIEVDPGSIEGTWRLAGDEASEVGPLFILRNGTVLAGGEVLGAYKIEGAVLSFDTAQQEPDGGKVTVAYRFDLPGPLSNPAAPSLLGAEIVRPERLQGTMETTDDPGFGDELELFDSCILVRID